MFLTRENDMFAFQNIAIARNEMKRNLTDPVSGSPTKLCKKHQYKDCGLRTADCGQPIQLHTSEKKTLLRI